MYRIESLIILLHPFALCVKVQIDPTCIHNERVTLTCTDLNGLTREFDVNSDHTPIPEA